MRIIFDNAADTATISATSETLDADNLLTDIKSEIWRATGTAATITLTWPTAKQINAAMLLFCNLTSAATMRVKGYTLTTDVTPVFDTGAVLCCPPAAFGFWHWGLLPLASNAYTNTAAYAVSWFTGGAVKKLEIIVDDAFNTTGTLDAGRVVVGSYFEPAVGAQYGSTKAGVQDSSTQFRTEAGDLLTKTGHQFKTVSFDTRAMNEADRALVHHIIAGNALTTPLFVSLRPEHSNPPLEQAHHVYGKMTDSSPITAARYGLFTVPISIQEV